MRRTLAFGAFLAVVLASATLDAGDPPVRAGTEVTATLDPAAHRLEAHASVVVEPTASGEAWIALSGSLRVREVLRDGKPAAFELEAPRAGTSLARVRLEPGARLDGPRRYDLRYDGTIHDPPRVARFSREQIADQTEGTIQPEGVFLSPGSGWYPRGAREPGTFKLEARLPAGWDAVAEGSLRAHDEGPASVRVVYEATRPTDGLHFVAGRWKRVESAHEGIQVAAYVFPEDADLAESYVSAVKRYLALYSSWIGAYPYDRFAVVENFFSTGYGMPGFTVLGKDVMRLPFIVDTSLGHEVAHNWWGNGVFVDEVGGNWCEGLTTFVADYHYRRAKGPAEAADYRRETCRDYTNYAAEAGKDFPLASFRGRTTAATRAVGYGKTAMVFSMLESRLGKDRFDGVLRRVFRENVFRPASWDTWRKAFSEEAGEDLAWFFEQWVRRPGAPRLALGPFEVREVPGAASVEHEVRGTLQVEGGDFRVDVPLVLEGEGRTERRRVETRGPATSVVLRVPFRPAVLRADPDQEVFRRLDQAEIPPVLSRLLGDPRTLFVLDDGAGEELLLAYREVAAPLARGGMGEVVLASRVEASSLAGRGVFLLGLPRSGPLRELLAGLPGEVRLEEGGFAIDGAAHREGGASLLAVGRRPGDPALAVALFHGLTKDAVRAAGRKLVHYGKYSYLAFVDGKNVAKGVARVDQGPLVLRLRRFW